MACPLQVDGGTLFTMKYSINGTIVVKSTLDFERFPAGSSASVVFNVSARVSFCFLTALSVCSLSMNFLLFPHLHGLFHFAHVSI